MENSSPTTREADLPLSEAGEGDPSNQGGGAPDDSHGHEVIDIPLDWDVGSGASGPAADALEAGDSQEDLPAETVIDFSDQLDSLHQLGDPDSFPTDSGLAAAPTGRSNANQGEGVFGWVGPVISRVLSTVGLGSSGGPPPPKDFCDMV